MRKEKKTELGEGRNKGKFRIFIGDSAEKKLRPSALNVQANGQIPSGIIARATVSKVIFEQVLSLA